jgi:hypothetical protein
MPRVCPAAVPRPSGFALACLLIVLGPASLAAQNPVGKIEGTVLGPRGQPVAGAQVVILGTAAGAITSNSGYYFINSVPAGVYSLRAQMIGFSPNEVHNVRVFADQTMTVGFTLQQAVALAAITVTVQQNPIVPRDQVTSKSIVTGTVVNDMPVDNLRQILVLQPGVVESGRALGLSIRGGRSGEAAVYVDGALVRSQETGESRLNMGTNALEEASVTTGALGAEFGGGQSGVISYVTRGGGARWNGALTYETDQMFGNTISVGYNRAEASLGGPIAAHLTFFLSGTLSGQLSDFATKGAAVEPTYVLGGLDTTVTEALAGGSTRAVDIPQFIQFSGQCDAALNYGYACQGRRRPYNWSTDATGQAKLQYAYGMGSRVSGTVLYSQRQARASYLGFNYQLANGSRDWSGAIILNWTQQVFRAAERELAFDLNLSYQADKSISGPLARDYEAAHRSPFNGWSLAPMGFLIDFDHFSDDTPAMYGGVDSLVITQLKTERDWDQLVYNIRTNQGTQVAYHQRYDLAAVQPYRMNPWAMSTGYSTAGYYELSSSPYLDQERRYTGRLSADWQLDRYNRLKFGGDAQRTATRMFIGGLWSTFGMDALKEQPLQYGLYAQDRLDLGDLVVELGLRYDHFNTYAYFPTIPGLTFAHPRFDPLDPTDPADSVFAKARGHGLVSPRLRVSFPVTDRTGFRLSYAHQVQSPDFWDLLSCINAVCGWYGRDLGFGRTILVEFGVRHAFTQDLVVDLAAYNKEKVSDMSFRWGPVWNPVEADTNWVVVATSLDYGTIRGVDLSLISRLGSWFDGTLTYSYQDGRTTGTDPYSQVSRTIYSLAIAGERVEPAQSLLTFGENRLHNIGGAVSVSVPHDFAPGTWYGAALRRAGAFLRFRFASGLPFTKLNAQGIAAEPQYSSRLPWTKELDLRLTKGLGIGGTDWTLFADLRNLLNFTTIISVFGRTGDVVDAADRTTYVGSEVARLEQEAGAFLAHVGPDSTLAILMPGDCSQWSLGPVNCVLLKRAEARFGNGDGVYTAAEYTTAFLSEYELSYGPYRRYAAPRHIRLGAELRF